jgi:hypothetical protein
MRAFISVLLLASAAILDASCAGPRASRLRADSPQVIEQARIRVLDQLPALDAASREMIQTGAPRIEFVGAPFGGSYWFCWTISSNRTAVLNAFSSLENLSDRPVSIREPLPASRY